MKAIVVLGCVLAIAGCAMETKRAGVKQTAAKPAVAKAPAPTLDDIAFSASNTNATMVLRGLVYDKLFAINDANTRLVWKDPARKRMLKVASLMGQGSFDRNYKGIKKVTTAYAWQAWVTAAPQAKEFCRATGLAGGALKLRLKQWLGLPPKKDYAIFAEFWVDRDDLIRPCPDPEVTDTQCNIAFEMSDGMPVNPKVTGMPDYLKFFQERLYKGAYGPGGAPWTRLGYTYDWNPATPIQGASEYIIKPNVTFEVIGGTLIEDYCKG
jgi:hypothetical protein